MIDEYTMKVNTLLFKIFVLKLFYKEEFMSVIATIKMKKPKIRKTWKINPVTKVIESKKLYNRKKKLFSDSDL